MLFVANIFLFLFLQKRLHSDNGFIDIFHNTGRL